MSALAACNCCTRVAASFWLSVAMKSQFSTKLSGTSPKGSTWSAETMSDEEVYLSLFRWEDGLPEELSALREGLPARLSTGDPVRAVTCASRLLNLFRQLNWTGPPTAELVLPASLLASWDQQSLQQLSWDGEPAYPLSRHPSLLYLAHLILVENRALLQGHGVWWAIRCLFTEQQLLEHRSASLWSQLQQIIETDLPVFMDIIQLSEQDLCELHLELGHSLLYYSQYETANKHFTQAQSLAKLSMELTGALGRRTRFQQRDTAQLLLQVTTAENAQSPREPCTSLPKDLRLGDDTLLEGVEFASPQHTPLLSPLQQATILGQCVNLQKSRAVQQLNKEETEAHLSCVLATPQCWSIQSHALFLRSHSETGSRRTAERAMMQLQELVDASNAPHPPAEDRLRLLYSVPLSPRWAVERELAAALLSLGAVQSAVEVYERLEMWEEVVRCYMAVGRRGKGEEVLRAQLAGRDTPTLWCLLGDVTEDPSCYQKAWELSNHRSARAQRSLGLHLLRKKKYEESIEALQQSLQINSLQEGLWFSLGCAASKTGEHDLTARAFQRCVTLDPDNAEAWSNLATAYLAKKDKVRAFRAYQEATKCSYENWMLWENLLAVSAEIREYACVLQAYHRLLDLKPKFSDVEVLQHLVRAVVEGTEDRSGQPASRLRKKVGELLGRITAQMTVGADVWKLYADFHFASDCLEDQEKGLLELQKAQRMVKLEEGWEREEESVGRVVTLTLQYSQACRRQCGVRKGGVRESLRSLSSAKLALQGLLTKTKRSDLASTEALTEVVQSLEKELELLLELISQLNRR